MLSLIELVAAEWAFLREESDLLPDEEPDGGPFGCCDALIERYRNLEVCLTYLKPKTARDAAILSVVNAECARNVEGMNDNNAGAVAEIARSSEALRDFRLNETGFADARALRAWLLSQSVHKPGRTLIRALGAELDGCRRKHLELDRAIVAAHDAKLIGSEEHELDLMGEKMSAIELAIASSRIKSDEDLATVTMLLRFEVRHSSDNGEKLNDGRNIDLLSQSLDEFCRRTRKAGSDVLRGWYAHKAAAPERGDSAGRAKAAGARITEVAFPAIRSLANGIDNGRKSKVATA